MTSNNTGQCDPASPFTRHNHFFFTLPHVPTARHGRAVAPVDKETGCCDCRCDRLVSAAEGHAATGDLYSAKVGEILWTKFSLSADWVWKLEMGVKGDPTRTSTVVAKQPFMGLVRGACPVCCLRRVRTHGSRWRVVFTATAATAATTYPTHLLVLHCRKSHRR